MLYHSRFLVVGFFHQETVVLDGGGSLLLFGNLTEGGLPGGTIPVQWRTLHSSHRPYRQLRTECECRRRLTISDKHCATTGQPCKWPESDYRRQEDPMIQWMAGFLMLAAVALAQDAQWERVKAIRPGEVIWVRHLEGTTVVEDQARMISCRDEGLAVRIGKKEVIWARSDIRSVRVYAGKSHSRGALWGRPDRAGAGTGGGGRDLRPDGGGKRTGARLCRRLGWSRRRHWNGCGRRRGYYHQAERLSESVRLTRWCK